jgi:hypothetical protein
LLVSSSSAMRSPRISERRIQVMMPRQKSSTARAKSREPTRPHCIRIIPYPKAERDTRAAKIQKITMAVPALYPRGCGTPVTEL